MNRYISKSYTTKKNTIYRQYAERGQLQCQLLLVLFKSFLRGSGWAHEFGVEIQPKGVSEICPLYLPMFEFSLCISFKSLWILEQQYFDQQFALSNMLVLIYFKLKCSKLNFNRVTWPIQLNGYRVSIGVLHPKNYFILRI